MFEPVDIYCERTEHGLWAEPINLLTNASFFIAAFLLYQLYRQYHLRDMTILALIALVAIVGLGSSLFHSFATHWSLLADVIPIMSFACVYLWVALRRLAAISWKRAAVIMLLFLYSGAQAENVPPDYNFNGSIAYFPCLAAILLLAAYLHSLKQPAARLLFAAGLTFAASLTLRSLDMALCDAIPIGVHYFWHLLNGVVLYLLVKALIIHCTHRQTV